MKPTDQPGVAGRLVVTAILVALGAAGCSDATDGAGTSEGGVTAPGVEASAAGVDPQILSDVVAGAFPMPGDTQRRTIRARLAVRSVANVACGGEPTTDLDTTTQRFNQARYADLELIRERGLVETEASGQEGEVDLAPECRADALPSYDAWWELNGPWSDITRTAVGSDAVTAVEPEVADCLGQASGLELEASDPTGSYLVAVDAHLAALDDPGEWEPEMHRLSDVYADCAEPYFETLEGVLAPEREAMVERHRELLERFAAELADAGYVP